MLERTKKMNFYFLIWTFACFRKFHWKEETFPSWLTFILNPCGLKDKSTTILFLPFIKSPIKTGSDGRKLSLGLGWNWNWAVGTWLALADLRDARLWDLMLEVRRYSLSPDAMLVLLPGWCVPRHLGVWCEAGASLLSPLLSPLSQSDSCHCWPAQLWPRPLPPRHNTNNINNNNNTVGQHGSALCPATTTLLASHHSAGWGWCWWGWILTVSEGWQSLSACWSPVLHLRMSPLRSLLRPPAVASLCLSLSHLLSPY